MGAERCLEAAAEPEAELPLPVADEGGGADEEDLLEEALRRVRLLLQQRPHHGYRLRPFLRFLLFNGDEGKAGNLDGLPEPHVVCEDGPVPPLGIEVHEGGVEPLDALLLVRAQLATQSRVHHHLQPRAHHTSVPNSTQGEREGTGMGSMSGRP